MVTRLTYTERTWGIDLISEINRLSREKFLRAIHYATGERGLTSAKGQNSAFPDVLLFSSDNQVVMGWELKLPDTDVFDVGTIENAKMKAERLLTNSFLIWNVNVAVLYLKDGDEWKVSERWDLEEYVTRDEVEHRQSEWMLLLKRILIALDSLLWQGTIKEANLAVVLGEPTYQQMLEAHVPSIQRLIVEETKQNRKFLADLDAWYQESSSAGDKKSPDTEKQALHLAENLIINWLNKLLFCHNLKSFSEAAYAIDEVTENTTSHEYLEVFDTISGESDFKSIFSPVLGQNLVTGSFLHDLFEIHSLLLEQSKVAGGDFDLTDSLQAGLSFLRDKSSGRFATPRMLAKLLVGLTVIHPRGNIIDPCCGSGTIAREIQYLKRKVQSPEEISATLWASDKFSIPVSFTGIAVADPMALGEVQQVFQEDVSRLEPGTELTFVDPSTGGKIAKTLPKMDYIVSNLPFVRFEKISNSQDKKSLNAFANSSLPLNNKTDLYAYILLGLEKLLAQDGRIGVLISNSWLTTIWGKQFKQALRSKFNIELIAYSTNGKWFANADVITTLLVLRKRNEIQPELDTVVLSINKPIESWNEEWVDDLCLKSLSGRTAAETNFVHLSQEDFDFIEEYGIYLPSGCRNLDLLKKLINVTSPAKDYLDIGRGTRPGWERLFFIKKNSSDARSIEAEYLKPLFHRPGSLFKGSDKLVDIESNYYLFDCQRSLHELDQLDHNGASKWIRSFENQRNGTGVPLPEVLNGSPYWYSVRGESKTNFLLQMAPDTRMAVYRPKEGVANVGQRFITLNSKVEDKELLFAILNSSISYLFQEITGFPKGLGALDRNPTTLKNFWRIPSLERFSRSPRDRILEVFDSIAKRPPKEWKDEIVEEDRQALDKIILEVIGMEEHFHEVNNMLVDLITSRRSVRGRNNS